MATVKTDARITNQVNSKGMLERVGEIEIEVDKPVMVDLMDLVKDIHNADLGELEDFCYLIGTLPDGGRRYSKDLKTMFRLSRKLLAAIDDCLAFDIDDAVKRRTVEHWAKKLQKHFLEHANAEETNSI